MKTPREITQEYSKKVQQAQQQSYKNRLIQSLSEADVESIKLLEQLDKASGGNLPKLYQAYSYIQHDSNQSN